MYLLGVRGLCPRPILGGPFYWRNAKRTNFQTIQVSVHAFRCGKCLSEERVMARDRKWSGEMWFFNVSMFPRSNWCIFTDHFSDKNAKCMDFQTILVSDATLRYVKCFWEEREMARDGESSVGIWHRGSEGPMTGGACFKKKMQNHGFFLHPYGQRGGPDYTVGEETE